MSVFRTGGASPAFGAGADVAVKTPAVVVLHAAERSAEGRAYPLVGDELVAGRDPSCLLELHDHSVSRRHARFHRAGDAVHVDDLDSRNGTFVDGVRVRSSRLRPGSIIRVGDALLTYVADGDAYLTPGGATSSPGAASPTLVGGHRMAALLAEVDRIAPTELSCVLRGETGTGKEVVARAIHERSGRPGAFQAVNCAAIPTSLFESELFGYRKGAFSGADRDKPGVVKLAHRGTLFLDEIGDMPPEVQAKLLRVLQSREVFPLGAAASEPVDLRVVSATHRDLESLVAAGSFRGDLYARLNDHTVVLAPLRDRREDVLPLARHFAARFAGSAVEWTFAFVAALVHYEWPYNVRELESCMKRAVALAQGRTLGVEHLPDAVREHMRKLADATPARSPSPSPAATSGAAGGASTPTREALEASLRANQGNVAAVAREFGKERMQIHRWAKRHGLSLDAYRATHETEAPPPLDED